MYKRQVLHLLYSRFWHKVLFDLGFVDSAEPFHKLFNQGMIQAYAYTDDRGQYVPAAEVVEGPADANGEPTFTWNGEHANREFGKMGKSLKNIITPDDMYSVSYTHLDVYKRQAQRGRHRQH